MRTLKQFTKDPQGIILFLESLRKLLIGISIVVLSLTLIGLYFASRILGYLKNITGVNLAAFGVPDTFLAFVAIALVFGLFAAVPYIAFAILSTVPPLFPSFSSRPFIRCSCRPCLRPNFRPGFRPTGS